MMQLNSLINHDLVKGLEDVKFGKNILCSSFQANKQARSTHPNKSIMSTSKPLELLHMDLFGPTTYTTISGNKYGVAIVDYFSRFTHVFFLNDKSGVFNIFNHFPREVRIILQ
jgi:hypothetical protein